MMFLFQKENRENGTLLLKLTLVKAKEKGIESILITCDEDNIGSRKIILKNNGIIASRRIAEKTGKPILRFWINV